MKTVKFNPELTAMSTKNSSESARILLDMIQEKSNVNVLDYGCGLIRNMKYLVKNSSHKIDGCDIPEQVKRVHENSEHKKFLLENNCTVTTSIELKKQYDYILNSHVLNVVQDDIKKIIVDDIYRLLKKGGKAVIQVRTKSDIESSKSKEKFGDGFIVKKGKAFTYQEAITKEKMTSLFENVGFKIIEHKLNSSIHILTVEK